MDARTLKALKGSIKKWEGIVAGTDVDDGDKNCPLCAEFLDQPFKEFCEGCPVSAATGLDDCIGTPYQDWHQAHDYGRRPLMARDDETVMCAVLELEFLKGLLP